MNSLIQLLVDVKGFSNEEAIETSAEYNGNVEGYIRDIGGDDVAVSEALAFCS